MMMPPGCRGWQPWDDGLAIGPLRVLLWLRAIFPGLLFDESQRIGVCPVYHLDRLLGRCLGLLFVAGGEVCRRNLQGPDCVVLALHSGLRGGYGLGPEFRDLGLIAGECVDIEEIQQDVRVFLIEPVRRIIAESRDDCRPIH